MVDTGSHLLFGLTLAGLAHLDPTLARVPGLEQAVMIGTVIGAHAPDFDTISRLRGYSAYIRHHRGISHSVPALFLWPLLITMPLAMAFQLWDYWGLLYFWTFLSVFFHVFLDMFNQYGVQSLRPFSKRWVHLDILHLFEPFLFFLHLAGGMLWIVGEFAPDAVFPWVYAISFLYIGVRIMQHAYLLRILRRTLAVEGSYHVFPSLHWFHWRYVVETRDGFYAGTMEYGKVINKTIYAKEGKNPIIMAAESVDDVHVFLQFAQRIHVSYAKLQDGYEVKWSDVRFWYDNRLPFGVDVRLDQNLRVVSHKFGWRKRAVDPPYV